MKRILRLLPIPVLFAAALMSGLAQSEHSLLRCASLDMAPTVDGEIAPGEWEAASGSVVQLVPFSAQPTLGRPAGSFRIATHQNKIFFAFEIPNMPMLPVADAQVNGDIASLERDDFVEFFIGPPGKVVQLIANGRGVFAATHPGGQTAGKAFRVAGKIFGPAQHIVEASVRRGMTIEGMFDPIAAGISFAKADEEWELQVISKNPSLSWSPIPPGRDILSHMGRMVFGGPFVRIDELKVSNGNRKIEVGLAGATQTKIEIEPKVGAPVRKFARPGSEKIEVRAPGGTSYQCVVSADHFQFLFHEVSLPAVPVLVVPNPSFESFFVEVDPQRPDRESSGRIVLRFLQDDSEKWRKEVDLDSMSEKLQVRVPYRDWKSGPCSLVVEQEAEDGSIKRLADFPLQVPTPPEWAGFQLPEGAPKIPSPFQPVQATENTASVWNRKFQFGSTPFLDAITTSDREMLHGPVTLRATVNGKPAVWKMTHWKKLSSDDEKAVFESESTAGDQLTLRVKTTVEYDGMVRFDWTVVPGNDPVEIQDMAFVVPVPSELAKYYYHYTAEVFKFSDLSTWNGSGFLTEAGWAGRFTPLVGVNNERHSMQVFTESRAGWAPHDPSRAIEIKKQGDQAEIIFNLIGEAKTLSRPLDYTIGLMPGPARERPNPSDLQASRIFVRGTMGEELALNETMRYASVVIPTSRQDFPEEGCVEMRFRVDWNPAAPDKPWIQLFESFWNYGPRMTLRWNTATKQFEVFGPGPDNRARLAMQAPFQLEKGTWYDIALNWSRELELWVDGKLIKSVPYSLQLPKWNRAAIQTLGGSGRIALAGWRISSGIRDRSTLARNGQWTSDKQTLHLETLKVDPTGMNITMPTTGGISNPAYLNGNWTYDPKEQILVAGEDLPSMTYIEHYARVFGARGLMLFYWCKGITGMGGFHDVEEFRRGTALARANGIRILPYTPAGIHSKAPEYSGYKWEFSDKHPLLEPVSWWNEKGDSLFSGANMGGSLERDLYWMDQLMRNGAGGIYTDGGVYFPGSFNPLMGLEKLDPFTGEPVPVANLFATREKWKKATRLVQHYDPGAIMDAHSSLGFPLPTMSHFTDANNGESIGIHPDWKQFANLGPFSAEFVGRPFGFNADALFYHGAPDIEYGVALALLHGMTPRPTDWGLRPERAQKLWQIADSFDTASAQWMPYSEPETSPLQPEDDRVLASAFVHPGKRALVFVVNWSDEPASGKVKLDFEKLGLPSDTPVHVLDTGETLTAEAGVLNLPLRPRRVLCLWVGDKTAPPTSSAQP